MQVDFSQLQCYINCPRLYCNKYVNCLQRRKQDEGMQSRSFGSDVHGALNQYFLTHSPATAIEWFKTHYESIPNEKIRTKEHGIILLQRFFPWWRVNFQHATVLGTEVQDSFKIGEIEYLVKIDLPVRVNDNVFAVDFKAQPLDSLVLTPSGWVKMETLKKGDYIIGSNGTPVTVTGIYPQGKLDCYTVEFVDGAKVECSKDHLWFVTNQYGTGNPQLFTLEEVHKRMLKPIGKYKTLYRFRVPIAKPIIYKNSTLSLHPYLLGVLLGDGCISGHVVEISIGKEDEKEMLHNIRKILPSGMIIKKSTGNNYSWILKNPANKNFNPIIRNLRKMNLMGKCSHNKFIPQEYFIASINDRLNLLQGLLDTDGCAYKGHMMFDSTSFALASGVVELVRSLGGTARLRKTPGTKKPQFRVALRLENGLKPFKLTRKLNKLRTLYTKPSRYIDSIEKTGIKEMQCISVSAEDGLYVTNDFIVTHNTTTNKTHYYYRQFSPNMQVSGYCYYLMLKYGSCAGFMPVVFHLGYRQNKYKGEPAGFWVKFDYDIVNRNKEQLNDFRYNVRMWVNKLQVSLDTGVFEKNEGFCESYYGCQYRNACIALDEPQVIENMYEVVNPREYLEKEVNNATNKV